MDGLTKDERRTAATLVGGLRGSVLHRQRHDQARLVRPGAAHEPRGHRGQPGRASRAAGVDQDQPAGVVLAERGQLVHRRPVQPRHHRGRHDGRTSRTSVWTAPRRCATCGRGRTSDRSRPASPRRPFRRTASGCSRSRRRRGAAIRVNDDDLRVSYDGTWQRNGNREVPGGLGAADGRGDGHVDSAPAAPKAPTPAYGRS